MTAAIATSRRVDGVVVEVQYPTYEKEEMAHLNATVRECYTEIAQVDQQLEKLLSYQKNHLAYRKCTEIAVQIIMKREQEGQFPQTDYAFDNGGGGGEQTIGKDWGSELECSRLMQWKDEWQRVETVANALRTQKIF